MGEVLLRLRSWRMRTWICAAWSGRSPSEAHKLTHAHLNLCSLECEKSFWSSEVDACAPKSVLPGVGEVRLKLIDACAPESVLPGGGTVILKLISWRIHTWICAAWSGRSPSEARLLHQFALSADSQPWRKNTPLSRTQCRQTSYLRYICVLHPATTVTFSLLVSSWILINDSFPLSIWQAWHKKETYVYAYDYAYFCFTNKNIYFWFIEKERKELSVQ